MTSTLRGLTVVACYDPGTRGARLERNRGTTTSPASCRERAFYIHVLGYYMASLQKA